jgi:hypothetical protein
MFSRRDAIVSAGAVGLGRLLPGCARSRASDVVAPWSSRPVALAADFVRGMNLAHQHARGHGYGSDIAAAQLDALAALGVRDIALNPFAYTPNLSSPDIRFGGDPTMTDDDLRAQIAQAHARGMRVLMKPHLWSWRMMAGSGNPDITLDPAGWAAWFAAYTRYVVHYARIAGETSCAGLCVGLEYTKASGENPGAWAAVAEACRAVFPGSLCYAANWYQEFARFADWDAFDCVGVNAYFPLTGRTVEELAASWGTHLDAVAAAAKGRPVVFPEAGYRAAVGATERPWEDGGGAVDEALQARAYEALLRACTARPWFKGVYWWKWFTDPAGEDRDAFVPAEPARAVLRSWFR